MGDIPNCPNFSYREFSCPCRVCHYTSGKQIDQRIPLLAQKIRTALDRPLKVNSACRCNAHNSLINGSLNSQHLPKNGFRAVDLGIKIAYERHIAIKIALEEGASVGVHDSFLHFDFRDGEPIVFLY